ncbi:hypothetical protein [Photobacterium damselae]|uniref:hypothetical protein n=1 Tax=Photobacterium damselae TaxID=38293 RepID=UPI001F1F6244|nr:hypothetical protein [Photobacterium damselae]UKA12904.1 hypothetical protein IHC91_21540 [Photobacterium damselae subsp. damselae]
MKKLLIAISFISYGVSAEVPENLELSTGQWQSGYNRIFSPVKSGLAGGKFRAMIINHKNKNEIFLAKKGGCNSGRENKTVETAPININGRLIATKVGCFAKGITAIYLKDNIDQQWVIGEFMRNESVIFSSIAISAKGFKKAYSNLTGNIINGV